ncbi:ComF family protein [Neorhizobium sp. NCHU2750]|uniref:ComF family protein n=1 Tax=Neorhizobium sp. NCHU2750 TaxID=1825976 RepID=UPI001FDFF23D
MVYPPVCLSCGALTGRHGGVCAACWSGVRFIERPYCEVLGLPFSYDPGPGMLSAQAIADPPVFARLRAAAIFDGAARAMVHGLKYRDRGDLAPVMAGWMERAGQDCLAGCDAILPVPLHRTRFALRKFNQAAELARHLSGRTGTPYLPAALVRTKRTQRQVGLTARARQDNVRAAFAIAAGHEAEVFGKRLVLIDDVYTTGATVSAATRALKKAGATEVSVLTFAMALAETI